MPKGSTFLVKSLTTWAQSVLGVASIILFYTTPAFTQGSGTFSANGRTTLIREDNTPKQMAGLVQDPTGSAPSTKVYKFSIPSGYCSDAPYDESGVSDCTFRSTRAQMIEDVWTDKKFNKKQPSDAWYGWYIFFPEDFPYGQRQIHGGYEFAYWHNGRCPHLSFWSAAGGDGSLNLVTNRLLGGYRCVKTQVVHIGNISDYAGRWVKFETFVKWSVGADGYAEVFVNGESTAQLKGPTLTGGAADLNYFKFGLYLCCTPSVAEIAPMDIYFANVRRNTTLDELRGSD